MLRLKLFQNVLCAFMLITTTTHQSYTAPTKQIESSAMIKLYVYPSCPYCKKVIKFLNDNNWADQVTIINVNIPENLKELKELNDHNTQCPFIYDAANNIKMLESDDIIQYFKTIFA